MNLADRQVAFNRIEELLRGGEEQHVNEVTT